MDRTLYVGTARLLACLALIGWAQGVNAQAADTAMHHQHPMLDGTLQTTQFTYEPPHVTLVKADGSRTDASLIFDDPRPVAVNFIYTSCSTICPLTSQVFAELQAKAAQSALPLHLVSISIDPEQDTPRRLREYAKKFHAASGWDYFTGSMEASVAVQRAFRVYRGDKMNHAPLTLLRTAPGAPWVRIDGLASAEQLLEVLRDTNMGSRTATR